MYNVHTDNERKASADAVEEGGMQNTYLGESNFVNARLSCCIWTFGFLSPMINNLKKGEEQPQHRLNTFFRI